MFLTEDDYIMASANSLALYQKASEEKRRTAEKTAVEEIAGYLRGRYDTEKVFSAEGDERNEVIVMRACDIAVYHLGSALADKMGGDIRKERYERAVKWLEDVQKGYIMPGLPTYTDESGNEDINCPTKWGSVTKQEYNW